MLKHIQLNQVTRLALLVVAVPVFLYSVSTAPVQRLVGDTGTLLANTVGIFAGVPSNPYNTLAQQLEDKEADLQAREAALASRETGSVSPRLNDWLGIAGFGISALVLLLVLVNFYLDSKRTRQGAASGSYAINLKK